MSEHIQNQQPVVHPSERAAVWSIFRARKDIPAFDHASRFSSDVTDRLFEFSLYHSSRDIWTSVVIDGFWERIGPRNDMWADRAKSLFVILNQAHSEGHLKGWTARQMLDFFSMEISSRADEGRAWTPLLGNLVRAREGDLGHLAKASATGFLDSLPGFFDRSGIPASEERGARPHTVEGLSYLAMQIWPTLQKNVRIEEMATARSEVKNLARDIAREAFTKTSASYEFLARVAREPSWNHLSARLKA